MEELVEARLIGKFIGMIFEDAIDPCGDDRGFFFIGNNTSLNAAKAP